MSRSMRDYHDDRQRETAAKLTAALERMRTNRRLRPSDSWSKKAWADEAGVNKDTVVAKNVDGSFKFARENAIFEKLQHGSMRLSPAQRWKAEKAELLEEILRLKRVLARQGGVP